MITKSPRVPIPIPVQKRVLTFYQGRPDGQRKCVVIGRTAHVELHHLDETPANSQDERNILPLWRELNLNLDHRKFRRLRLEISPGSLAERANEHFANGRYAHAYGCSVLGASLASLEPWRNRQPPRFYNNETDTALFAANALVSLRPLNRVDYASHVIHWIVLPVLRLGGNRIQRPILARLAMELGSYFRDALWHSKAFLFTTLAHHLLRGEALYSSTKTLLARLDHHDAITYLTCNRQREAAYYLERGNEQITAAYKIGFANYELYRSQLRLRDKNPNLDEVIHAVKPYIRTPNPAETTLWTARELQLTLAQALYQRGGPRWEGKAFEVIRGFFHTAKRDRVVPTGAVFPMVLHAFVRADRKFQPQLDALTRILPPKFTALAEEARILLLNIAKSDPLRIIWPNPTVDTDARKSDARGSL